MQAKNYILRGICVKETPIAVQNVPNTAEVQNMMAKIKSLIDKEKETETLIRSISLVSEREEGNITPYNFKCELCDIFASGEASLRAHMNGKCHKSKAKKTPDMIQSLSRTRLNQSYA